MVYVFSRKEMVRAQAEDSPVKTNKNNNCEHSKLHNLSQIDTVCSLYIFFIVVLLEHLLGNNLI